MVNFEVTAFDEESTEVSIVCTPPSGSQFGVTTVTCVATDDSGNEATCQFKVTVIRNSWEVAFSSPADLQRARGRLRLGGRGEFSDSCRLGCLLHRAGCLHPGLGLLLRQRGNRSVLCREIPVGRPGGLFSVTVAAADAENVVWPRAMEIPSVENLGVLTGFKEQVLGANDESRWYKFKVQPGPGGGDPHQLPANYDLVLLTRTSPLRTRS